MLLTALTQIRLKSLGSGLQDLQSRFCHFTNTLASADSDLGALVSFACLASLNSISTLRELLDSGRATSFYSFVKR